MSADYTRLRLAWDNAVARVTLARPEARNAFDEELIAELTRAFSEIAARGDIRAAILAGEGPVFCAGADIAWMRRAGGYTRAENEADADKMARMFRAIDACPKPVIVLAHGAAIGGGVGLVAAADIAIASEETVFSMAEVKLGILPAVISPYVLRAIGPRAARDLFLTGDRFGAAEAHRIGLVHAVVPPSDLESACQKKLKSLLSSGPEAVRAAKAMIEKVTGLGPEEAMSITVRAIAERRASGEAKEGLSAFLEKRPAKWTKDSA